MHYQYMTAQNRNHNTQATVARNLRALMDMREWSEGNLAKRSHVAQKTINNILNLRSNPGVATVDALAQAFGLRGWHLLIPDLPTELATSPSLSKLVENWAKSSPDGRSLIEQIADRESERGTA